MISRATSPVRTNGDPYLVHDGAHPHGGLFARLSAALDRAVATLTRSHGGASARRDPARARAQAQARQMGPRPSRIALERAENEGMPAPPGD
jgi:hypothetical protein